jgi:hypothetical protein
VSRGPGTWQRQILHTTSSTVVATVSGIVRTTVVAPDRSDYTAARRGTKQLALAERVAALYVWGCTRCMRIQDSETPQPCCGPVRSLLAVCQPERRRLLLHPAPAPGGRAPSWINVAVPSRPQGQFLAPGVHDVAALAIRLCYQRLEAGEHPAFVQDAVALARLAWQIEHDDALAERDRALAQAEEFRCGMRTALWTARKHIEHIDPGRWRLFMDDLRRQCEQFASREGGPRTRHGAGARQRGGQQHGLGAWTAISAEIKKSPY